MMKVRVVQLLLLVTASGAASANSVADVVRQGIADHQLDCAAAVLALSNDDELASLIAADFVMRAVSSSGRAREQDELEAATRAALARAIARSAALRTSFNIGENKRATVERQEECVLARLNERN